MYRKITVDLLQSQSIHQQQLNRNSCDVPSKCHRYLSKQVNMSNLNYYISKLSNMSYLPDIISLCCYQYSSPSWLSKAINNVSCISFLALSFIPAHFMIHTVRGMLKHFINYVTHYLSRFFSTNSWYFRQIITSDSNISLTNLFVEETQGALRDHVVLCSVVWPCSWYIW